LHTAAALKLPAFTDDLAVIVSSLERRSRSPIPGTQ
jgi:hypothetical protein